MLISFIIFSTLFLRLLLTIESFHSTSHNTISLALLEIIELTRCENALFHSFSHFLVIAVSQLCENFIDY